MCKRKLIWPVVVTALFLSIPAHLVAQESAAEYTEVEDDGRVWTVAVIADLNGPYGSKEYNQYVHGAVDWISNELEPDLVISTGDMVAGQQAGHNYGRMWQAFHDVVTDELAQAGIPLAVTPGNHDASEQPQFWEERVEFAQQWNRRRPNLTFVDDAFYPFFYAFELGPALFIALDGTGIGDLDDGQLAWIDDVLETNAHLEVSVLFSHVPQNAVAQGREHEIFDDDRLAELMEVRGVDMMVSGHHHAYYPAKKDGTYLLHTSALGSGVRALIGQDRLRRRNVAVFEFSNQGIESIEAFDVPNFEQAVELQDLPESLGEGDHKLWRMDVEEPDEEPETPES